MIVELTKEGTLKIQAENELEAYALKKWIEENSAIFSDEKLNKGLLVCYGLETPCSSNYRGR